MAKKPARRQTGNAIPRLARKMLESLELPPVEAQPLELVEVHPPEECLGIEDRQLDPVHAWLLARASIAQHLANLFAKTKPLSEEESAAIWVNVGFLFDFTCAPTLIGTSKHPAPTRSYGEIAKIIHRFVTEHCSALGRLKGRPRKAPPDSSWFSGIEELAERFREMQEDIVRPYKRRLGRNAWSSGAATKRLLNPEKFDESIDVHARESFESFGVTLDDLRDQPLRRFLLARLKEEPTGAALHVAWTLAKAEHGYDGSLRAFSDAWREHGKRSRPD
jgi:hypothetical protein